MKFAKDVGISPVYLQQLAANQDGRQPSHALALKIHDKSGERVPLWELRSDWHVIWPHLIEAKDAPKVRKAAAGRRTADNHPGERATDKVGA